MLLEVCVNVETRAITMKCVIYKAIQEPVHQRRVLLQLEEYCDRGLTLQLHSVILATGIQPVTT